MAVKANVKIFQEAMSNMLPPSSVQTATLSDMLLSIYRGLWWHMCPGSALVQLITVKHCIEHFGLSHESNRAGINNWSLVKNSHSGNIRHKHMQQSNNLITLSNSFEVLGNLYESSDKAVTNIPKANKALRVQRNRPITPKKYSVLLVGDSHIRGVAEILTIKQRSSFHTIGYVKPNANLYNITSLMKSKIKILSKSDVVVLCGAMLDVARNNTMKGHSSVLQFVKNSEHTNVIIMDAPHRIDLRASSCVNK
jgi:hypothetical protein